MNKIKEAIKSLLHRLGLFPLAYRLYSRLRGWKHGSPTARAQRFYGAFEAFVQRLEAQKPLRQDPTLLFYGYMVSTRKQHSFRIMQELMERRPDCRVLLVNNTLMENRQARQHRTIMKTMVPCDALEFPEVGQTTSNLELTPTQDMLELVEAKAYLRDALENARCMFPRASEDFLKVLVCQYYRCYNAMLDNINVSCAVIWNAFKYHHFIFSEICKERGVSVVYTEFGSLPGTMVIDPDGQMGESYPAVHYEEFNALSVSEEECQKAARVVSALRQSGLNRNAQPTSQNHDELRARLKSGRPLVVFAGQFDRDSGMIPYTETTRKYHSPCFQSTVEAMRFCAALAKKHDWNFIFKPHPSVKHEVAPSEMPEGALLVTDININDIIDMADVVITILSSTAYVSLIRETATVMLGCNQITGKGCAYEALQAERIEETLVQAVEQGYTDAQRAAFLRHVAQMDKYYLFSDGADHGEATCGKPLSRAVALFEQYLPAPAQTKGAEGHSLFVCRSLTGLMGSWYLHRCHDRCEQARLLLVNPENWAKQLDLSALESAFSAVETYTFPTQWTAEDDEERLTQYEALVRRLMDELPLCSDLYFDAVTMAHRFVALAALRAAPDTRLHLFYPKGIASFSAARKGLTLGKLFSEEETALLSGALREVLLLNPSQFTRSAPTPGDPVLTVISPCAACYAGSFAPVLSPAFADAAQLIRSGEQMPLTTREMLSLCSMVNAHLPSAQTDDLI